MSPGGFKETPTARPGEPKGESPSHLSRGVRIVVVIGALGSLGLMLYVGRHNPSLLLLGVFMGWVLSPFVALLMADRFALRRPVPQGLLHSLALLISFGSLAVYSAVVVTSPPKPAFWFLVVPPGSWLLLAIGALGAGRLSHGGAGS